MNTAAAETLALEALGFLASDDDLRDVFMGASGLSVQELAARASERDFLVSVLEFLTMDDAWVVKFCDANGRDYGGPLKARYALSGPETAPGVGWD